MARLTSLRTLGLDVGDRRIGIAITDLAGITVQGRPTRIRRGPGADIDFIRDLVVGEDVRRIVVGYPLHMDGRESPQGLKTRAFAQRLQDVVDVPVVLWDERLTSVAAEQDLEELGMNWRKRREYVDQRAAVLILEDFLREES